MNRIAYLCAGVKYISPEISYHWDAPTAVRKRWILPHISALLYLREIDAEDLVEFVEKPPPCQEHLGLHAAEAGIEHVLTVSEQLLAQVLADAQISFQARSDGGVDWRFDHPQFEHSQWGMLSQAEVNGHSEDEMRALVYRSMSSWFVANLSSDVATSHNCGSPLGSVIWFHQRLLLGSLVETQPAQVAFDLSLPILEGVSTKELLKIRHEEKAHFDQFRHSLRLAIQERLKISRSEHPARLAREIQEDLVEPELARIRTRLNAARAALAGKTITNVTVAALGTVVGSFLGQPLAGAAMGAVLSAGPLHSYFDDVKGIEQSDMFFLWKAVTRHE